MSSTTAAAADQRELIIKIDNSHGNVDDTGHILWRSPSCEFWNNNHLTAGYGGSDNSRTAESDGNSNNVFILDPVSPVKGVIDHENMNPNHRHSNLRERKVSFGPSAFEIDYDEREFAAGSSDEDDEELEESPVQFRRRSSNLSRGVVEDDEGIGEVVKCSSFQRRSSLIRTKTHQSRLMDPPELPFSGLSHRSAYRSGILARASVGVENDEDDDPLLEDDNPEDFKKAKLDALTILQWISLVLIMTALICTLKIRKWKRRKFHGLFVWEWEVLVLVLICGRLVSGWGIRLVVFFIERNFLLRKRILYFVYGIRKAVQNCIWLGLLLIAWNFMFDERVEGQIRFLRVLNKFMLCLLIATSLWLLKTLLVKVLASSFHVSKFFDRIQEALFHQYVIETLSGPPLIEIQNHEEESMASDGWKFRRRQRWFPPDRGVKIKYSVSVNKKDEKDEDGITIDYLHRLNPKNVSAWNMKRLMKIVRKGGLTTLDEQLHESATQIRSEIEAKRAARKIFMNVARRKSKYIYLDDLRRFLREEEAIKTMALLGVTPEDERVSRRALKNWVVNTFRDRKALALTLNDTKTAVNRLHRMVSVLMAIIIFVIWLLILNIATSQLLVLISSQIVLVAFIFGNTCKTIFESIVFLFVMHPFDVGDRCEIEGVQMIVEEMNILTTVFLRGDNQKIYYPNSTLSTIKIGNYYRSPDMFDTIDFLIHVATPTDKIVDMKQRIISLIESNKDHWYTDPIVITMNMDDLNRLKLSVWLQHKINHQDITERLTRRSLVIEEMLRIFKELDIEYRMYPIDINIRRMPSPVTSSRMPSTWVTDK